MTYSEHHTALPLSYFIEKIWYCKAEDLTSCCLTIPLPYHELVFNFSEHYKICPTKDGKSSIENPAVWISGLQSKPYYSFSSGRHEMLGVLFKADGLKAFQKYHAVEFSDQFIDARLVFGPSIDILFGQLEMAADVTEKITLTEQFLQKALLSLHQPAYLRATADQLKAIAPGRGKILQICKQASVTNKTLIETYRKHVGFKPARYAQLEKVNQAVAQLAKSPRQSLTSLAYELGFYDQSHFIFCFKSFTDLTPKAFAAHVLSGAVDPAAPNFISVPG
jgi:AraC-like DNA-binding protein